MAKFLFCWELGGGLGHTTLIRPFAEALQERGHEVLAAVREVDAARRAFGEAKIPYLPAPFKSGKRERGLRQPRCYAHLLHNNGYASIDELSGLVAAWRNLFDLYQPDVILFNHSPTALLAARNSRAKRVLLGDAFCSPPATSPLPVLRPWAEHDHERLARDEQIVLGVANRALAEVHGKPLNELADLYGQADEKFLLTFAELDHFGAREQTTYRGVFNTCAAGAPRWPDGQGPKVFAYLKPMQGLGGLLQTLGELGCRTLAHGVWVKEMLASGKEIRGVQFEPNPVNLNAAASECDLAILNATHGTTAAFLLAGKPVLQMPIVVEQVLTARNTRQIGCGLLARRNRPDEIRAHLERLLRESGFAASASAFAARYANFHAEEQRAVIVDELDDLCR